ncbi:MAG: membrane dipeptidase [Gemmatimonadaceae bacterium]|jgi:microsomal dipeptidase-like Zn-dependent dipeptidase|nr:membrane dipeptidase [Gemmatimonadaceae bacterium]
MAISLRRGAVVGVLLVAALLGAAFAIVPGQVDRSMNRIVGGAPFAPSPAAARLHASLFIADLHADQLLWNRDPLAPADHGHVDVPRLVRGHVGLQVFSAVTKTPRNMNYVNNTGDTDNITALVMIQRWPMSTWRSLTARAVFQSTRLHNAAADAPGRLRIITTRDALATWVAERAAHPEAVGALLAIEGMHAIEGRLDRIDTLFAAGYRMMGLTHFFDNELGGSAHGVTRGGLTPFGRTAIARMEQLGIAVDVAHAAPALVDDVLRVATRPVVVSHTGVVAVCPGPRNLTDDQLRRIAATRGVIGIGYWDGATCGQDVARIVASLVHAVRVAGVAHVALGSDFDGAVTVPFDTSELVRITQGLLDAGLDEAAIRAVMGENVVRVLGETLPAAPR